MFNLICVQTSLFNIKLIHKRQLNENVRNVFVTLRKTNDTDSSNAEF